MAKFKKFSIIGGGSWGSAIACHVARIHNLVKLYSRSENVKAEINTQHTNNKYLGSIKLPKNIRATCELQDIIDSDIIFIVVPSIGFEELLDELKLLHPPRDTIFLIASKGVSTKPVKLFSELFQSKFDNQFAFFSGPNLANEVASGKFATATISSVDIKLAKELALILESPNFEVATSNDVITIQIASLIKNIIAIESGILAASNAGENARAWLVTKALQEIWYISKILGGKQETLINAAVVGDLILTSYSRVSRNTKFGFELYNNNYSTNFIQEYPNLVEGLKAARALQELLLKYKIDLAKLPILNSIIKKL